MMRHERDEREERNERDKIDGRDERYITATRANAEEGGSTGEATMNIGVKARGIRVV
jgi:hypothetical protein